MLKAIQPQKHLFLTAIITVLFLATGCSTIPITGRSGLHLVPESELIAMGSQQYDEVLSDSQLSRNYSQVQMVRRVGNRIAQAAERFLIEHGHAGEVGYYQWEFNLIEDSDTANAWVMPGGKAAVYTGILKYTRDETGMAVVLGHEVAHAIAGHGNERMSGELLANMGGMALSTALSSQPQATYDLFMQAYGAGASVGFLLPYSRLHESEADRIGLILMARAGYDPRAAVGLWQRMGQDGGPRPPEFLSTHPSPASRITDIQRHLPEALVYYQGR